MNILSVLVVWFLGSIPLALIVGRLLATKDRAVELEPMLITVEPEPQSSRAS